MQAPPRGNQCTFAQRLGCRMLASDGRKEDEAARRRRVWPRDSPRRQTQLGAKGSKHVGLLNLEKDVGLWASSPLPSC